MSVHKRQALPQSSAVKEKQKSVMMPSFMRDLFRGVHTQRCQNDSHSLLKRLL